MRILDVAQGSPEWHRARLGIPTASCFDKILTPKTLKPSASAETYMRTLLAEHFIGIPPGMEPTGFMTRGVELEEYAARYYAFTNDADVRTVGFVTRDDGMVGCSPDRLVGVDGGLEIKCPSAAVHIGNLLAKDGGVQIDYRLQIQGCLWLCQREWWDALSYHPDLPDATHRVNRDEDVINALRVAIDAFVDEMLARRDTLMRLGCTPARATMQEVF